MKNTERFTITFAGLKQGQHYFQYDVNGRFFEDYDDILDANLKVNLNFVKRETLLELDFKVKGTVNMLCDLTNQPFDLLIEGNLDLIVKFGNHYSDDDDKILILPYAEHQIDITQYIYEMTILHIPLKRVNPLYKNNLQQIMTFKDKRVIKKYEPVDPRWNKLKKLLTK